MYGLNRFTIRPEGGHLDEQTHAGMQQRLTLQHESPRCMYPGEFIRLLHTYTHPRWLSLTVISTRWGARPREEVGLSPSGTVVVSNNTTQHALFSIPQDCIPYSTVKTAQYDEDRNIWLKGDIARGWRGAVESLIQEGYLRPHDYLTYLIGKDSFSIGRDWWR